MFFVGRLEMLILVCMAMFCSSMPELHLHLEGNHSDDARKSNRLLAGYSAVTVTAKKQIFREMFKRIKDTFIVHHTYSWVLKQIVLKPKPSCG